MTDRQQVERLMAIVEQAREGQRVYNVTKKQGNGDQIKKALADVRMKWDAVDNLFKVLRQQGYVPTKHTEADQSRMF
jgi:regulatory protein YycH of two-component signal transduction system YycFG